MHAFYLLLTSILIAPTRPDDAETPGNSFATREFATRPKISEEVRRRRRNVAADIYYEEDEVSLVVQLEMLVLHLTRVPGEHRTAIDWISDDGDGARYTGCDFLTGYVAGHEKSSVGFVTLCGTEVRGYVQVGKLLRFVEPVPGGGGEHRVYTGWSDRSRRSADAPPPRNSFYNLTGDMLEEDGSGSSVPVDDFVVSEEAMNDSITFESKWRPEDVVDKETFGYFVDSAWDASFCKC